MVDDVVLPGTGQTIRALDRGADKTQVMAIDAGGAAGELLVDALHPFPISVNAANFIFSVLNSSTSQLAANATFTGTIETALNQPSISLLMTSDQPMTLTVNQYIDVAGTFAATPIVFNIPTNKGLAYSLPINGNYIKITCKNIGTATSTTFNLNTAYGTIGAADEGGRLPVSDLDCVTLMNTTVSATGRSASIDTKGFGSIVAQLSGMWTGYVTFEGSNDNVNWDLLFVLPRDSVSLQDMINSGGVYTINPSVRYLCMVTTQVTGTIGVNIQGRSEPGISGADFLAYAMDRNNNMPLNVSLMGTKQDNQGALFVADGDGPYIMTQTNSVLILDTLGYNSITVQGIAGSGTIVAEFSDVLSGPWVRAQGLFNTTNSNFNPAITYQCVWSPGTTGAIQLPCPGRYMRLSASSFNAAAQASVYKRSANVTAVPTNVVALNTQSFVGEGSSVSQPQTTVGGMKRGTLMSSPSNNTAVYNTMTNSGALVVESHAVPEMAWSYAAAASGIANSTAAVTIKAAVASQRCNITSMQVNAEALGTATEFAIRDGAGGTVLFRIKIPTAGLAQQNFVFDPPLKTAAVNTLVEVVTLTASGTGAVYVNAQGFMSN